MLGQFGFAWATHKCYSHGGEVASFKNLPDTRDQADDVLLLFVLDGRHKHEWLLTADMALDGMKLAEGRWGMGGWMEEDAQCCWG